MSSGSDFLQPFRLHSCSSSFTLSRGVAPGYVLAPLQGARGSDADSDPNAFQSSKLPVFQSPILPSPHSSTLPAARPAAGFTLVEMLVVMVVIAILVGIVSGMVLGILRKGKIQKAQQEVREIQLAVEEYFRVFRELPITNTVNADVAFTPWYPPGATGPWNVSPPPTGWSDYTMASNFYDRLSGSNPLGRDFLHIARTAENSDRGALLDPWKFPYTFYLDSDYNDTVYVIPGRPDYLIRADFASAVGSKCIVRCFGPNKVPVNYPQLWAGNDDDIYFPNVRGRNPN